MNEPADIQLLLIGPTGQGRSATGNAILGRNAFISSSSFSSLTSAIGCELSEVSCRRVKVIDGPGVGYTHENNKKAVNLHMASMEYAIAANPRGYDAFLLVVRFGEKYTTEINETFDCLRKIFGQDFTRNFCILVVTGGDLFKQETVVSRNSIEEWIDEHPGVLRDLMNECERRVVLFDNLTIDETTRYEQVEKILKIVDDLKSQGTRYTDDNFAHAREGRQRYIVEAQKQPIQEEAMLEANLILKGVEDVQSVNDLETKIFQLSSLQSRAQNLLTKITSLDNGTGVLKEIIGSVKWVWTYVDDRTNSFVRIVNQSDRIQYQRNKTRQIENTQLLKEVQQTENTQLSKEVQKAEDTDATIAKELSNSDDFQATNIQETQEKLVEERCRDNANEKEISIPMQLQDEPNKQQTVCQDTVNTESEETMVSGVSDHKIDAASKENETCVSTQVDLLMIGKTGEGKSALGNSILRRRQVFKSSSGTRLVTKTVSYGVSLFNGRVITIVDSPGVEEVKNIQLVEAMESTITINPRGYNAFLLVVRFEYRLTQEDVEIIDFLKKIFGQDFVKNFCILVMTWGDCFEDYCENYCEEEGISFQEWCNERIGRIKDLMEECDKRVVLFNNRTNDLTKQNDQIENLLKFVDNLSSRGQRYGAANFLSVRESRDKLLAELKTRQFKK